MVVAEVAVIVVAVVEVVATEVVDMEMDNWCIGLPAATLSKGFGINGFTSTAFRSPLHFRHPNFHSLQFAHL